MTQHDELPRREAAAQAARHGPAPAYASARRERSRALRKLIPFLMLAAIAALIVRQEVPGVAEWWEKTFAAEDWALKQTCRDAIMEAGADGRYLRLVRNGEVHRTGDGPYVDGLRTVELSASGIEQTIDYTCYLDQQGKLFRLNRQTVPHRP